MKKRNLLYIALAIIILFAFLSTSRCDEPSADTSTESGTAVDTETGSEPEEEIIWHNGSGMPAVTGGIVAVDEPEPYCGDGNCDAGEDYQSCNDCEDPVYCYSDADCYDGDPCTPDICYFAGDVHAYCATERITERRFNDGCCPQGAWVDTDSDCEPVCGNHRCEYGEHTEDCPEDCKYAGGGGTSGSTGGQGGQRGGSTT